LDGLCLEDNLEIDYLLLPAIGKHQRPSIIDWDSVNSVMFSCENHVKECPKGYAHSVHTKDGPVCTCMLQNCLVCTPHNPHVYCITGILELNENATLKLRDNTIITYKQLYEERYVFHPILFVQYFIFGCEWASIYSLPCQQYVIQV
jgi:endoribonuclease Dicer